MDLSIDQPGLDAGLLGGRNTLAHDLLSHGERVKFRMLDDMALLAQVARF